MSPHTVTGVRTGWMLDSSMRHSLTISHSRFISASGSSMRLEWEGASGANSPLRLQQWRYKEGEGCLARLMHGEVERWSGSGCDVIGIECFYCEVRMRPWGPSALAMTNPR
ncbi:hypothetical protein HBI22_184800 [Parastagonospora nodorum]|nr:hypothetical protein HBI22_184800 [Parastagonospora nodorum]